MITGFNIDIYDCTVTFAWDTNEEELVSFLEKIKVPYENVKEILDLFTNTPQGVFAFTGPLTSSDVITVFIKDETPKTVAHEIYHLCYQIMTKRGIKDEEAWAYLIGYITQNYYDLREGKIKANLTTEKENE